MRLPTTALTTLLREVRARIRRDFPGGRVIVVVDGPSRSGTRAFADGLAAVFDEADAAVFRASAADFLLPRAVRTARRAVAAVAYEIDDDSLRRVLIDPFRDGSQTSATTGFQLAAWDADRDAPVEARWATGPADAVLVLDAPLLAHPELRALWDFALWVGPAAAGARAAGPEAAASLSIDTTDPDHPEIRRNDAP